MSKFLSILSDISTFPVLSKILSSIPFKTLTPSIYSGKILKFKKCKYPQLPGILGAWSVIPIISRPIDAAYFAFSVTVLYACPLETV